MPRLSVFISALHYVTLCLLPITWHQWEGMNERVCLGIIQKNVQLGHIHVFLWKMFFKARTAFHLIINGGGEIIKWGLCTAVLHNNYQYKADLDSDKLHLNNVGSCCDRNDSNLAQCNIIKLLSYLWVGISRCSCSVLQYFRWSVHGFVTNTLYFSQIAWNIFFSLKNTCCNYPLKSIQAICKTWTNIHVAAHPGSHG